jgi:hypothetical protein
MEFWREAGALLRKIGLFSSFKSFGFAFGTSFFASVLYYYLYYGHNSKRKSISPPKKFQALENSRLTAFKFSPVKHHVVSLSLNNV